MPGDMRFNRVLDLLAFLALFIASYDAYMVTGECLPVHQNLVFSSCWLVEARKQEMKVHRQCSHRCNFLWSGPNNLGHGLGRLLSQQLPLSERGVLEIREMTTHTD